MSELNESLNNSHSLLVKSVFSDLEKSKTGKFTYEEIAHYLSKKSGKAFNNELLLEIFHSVDLTQDASISPDQFISGYQKTEFMLDSQISMLKQQISSNLSNLSKAQKNLLESKSQKILNKAENSLYLTIEKVENLKLSHFRGKAVIRVICESHEILTDLKELNDLFWSQSFTIPISTGQGDIVIQLCVWEYGSIKDVVCEISVPFYALAKQELHEDTLSMKPKNLQSTEDPMISLSIQWIYDLEVYLDGMIKQYEEAIKEDKNQLEILNNFLAELKIPTDSLVLPGWVKNNENLNKVEKIVSSTVQEVFEKVEFFQGENNVRWGKVLNCSLFCFFFLTIFNCFFRPDFFNLTVLVYAVLYYVKAENLAVHYRVVAAGLALSQFSDVIYSFRYQDEKILSSSLGTIYFYTILCNFILKFVFISVFWKISIDSKS